MKYIIYVVLLLMSFYTGHLKSGISLSDLGNNAGDFGEYIGGVYLSPLILPTIIFFIVKIFRRKKETSYIRCSNWVLGVIIVSSISQVLTHNTPRHITFPAAQVTFTVPDRGWKLNNAKSGGRDVKMLFSADFRVAINAERHTQDELKIHDVTDISAFTKRLLGDKYDSDLYQVYRCTAENFRCAFQTLSIELKEPKKEVIYVYLLDKDSVIQLTAIFSEEDFDKNYATFKTILNSAVNGTP